MAEEKSQPKKIIVWDADQAFREELLSLLRREGLSVTAAPPPADMSAEIRRQQPVGLVVGELDLVIDGRHQLEILRHEFPGLPLLPVVAVPSVEGAISAIRLGVVDYLLKSSLDPQALLAVIKRVLAGDGPATGGAARELVYRSPAMERLLRLARKAAASDATVLIQGESGTGKELLARFIHGHSVRAAKRMVAINCAALPSNLLESELFGHEKGAFTGAVTRKPGKFELANGSTVLLDEITEMDLALQSKLLRVIQEGEVDRVGGRHPVPVDVRLIATTNRILAAEVEAGNFRQDLFFRLNVIPLVIPPLRERREDIDLLLENFILLYSRRNRKQITGLSPAARQVLHGYDFPGNVRELENIIERAVVLADGPLIEPGDLFLDGVLPAADGQDDGPPAAFAAPGELPLPAGTRLEDMERYLIFKTLREVDNNRTHAARMLGISIRTLRNKLREYREKYGSLPAAENPPSSPSP